MRVKRKAAHCPPLYERLKHCAVFGPKLGRERLNGKRPSQPKDVHSMGRQNWFDAVGEHRHVRRVGIFDQSSFAKYELSGRDAQKALD